MDIALLVLTGALVLTTIVYAYFTAKMADEMRESRELSVRPRLALDIHMLGPSVGMVELRSLGPGTAVDIAVMLAFTPPGETRAWRSPVFAPGQTALFDFPDPAEGAAAGHNMESLKEHGVRVALNGSLNDIEGREYLVEEALSVADWWSVVSAADQLFRDHPTTVANREREKLRRVIEKAQKDLHTLASRRGPST